MTSFLIHVGYPKTGTTFLQECYFPNHSGFNFLGCSSVCQEDDFALSIMNDFSFDEPKELPFDLDADVLNVFSSEVFTSGFLWSGSGGGAVDFRTAHRLKKTFGNARILMVLRNQRSMIASLYFQYVVEGGVLSFSRFIEKSLNDSAFFKLEQLQYDRLIDCYQSVFGKQNILILPYEMMVVDMSLFLAKIESFCGVEAFRPENKRVNSSCHTKAGFVVHRFLNLVIPSNLRRTLFFRKVCHKLPSMVNTLTTGKPDLLLDDDLLESLYTSSNARVGKLTDLNLAKHGYCVPDS